MNNLMGSAGRVSLIRKTGRAGEISPDRRPRVLAVDDDDRNLLAIEVVLKPVAEIVRARSGEEALRLLLKEEFAVILLDVLMPGIDGYETAHLLRQRERSKRTPIIFLTAITKDDSHMLRGYDMGAVDFVFKPFEPTILKSKVAVFVDLFNKTREIEEKATLERRLMEENFKANSERLRIEQALRHSEERQALILKSLPLALYTAQSPSQHGSPRFVGGDLMALTGFEARAFEADPALWGKRIHPDDKDAQAMMLDALERGGTTACEYRWKCADGSYKHFLNHATILRGSATNEGTVAGTLLDVTERRELAGQLVQAQKLDAIGKLTGGIAHDFNNLLASVLGGLSVIERRIQPTEEVSKILELTRHAAEQGAELITRMLAFSRRQQLRPDIVTLPKLASDLNGLLAPVLGGLIQLSWQMEENLWSAFVDPQQLELALMNIVFNARDAMSSGGTITVSGRNVALQNGNEAKLPIGEYIVIAVEDTGSGIPEDLLERVIEPFFTTKDVGKGTGLGLSTVYGFAKQSGGTLRIKSEIGRGTTVELWLPRSTSSPVEKPAARGTDDRPTVRDERPSTTVLLVDDSSGLLATTAALLRDQGYRIETASGGAEALAILEREPDCIDVIVTDYAMPLVSGLEVVRFARNLRTDWPAIIISGYVDVSAIENRPDNVPLLSKPFTEAALLEALEVVTQPRRRLSPAAPQ